MRHADFGLVLYKEPEVIPSSGFCGFDHRCKMRRGTSAPPSPFPEAQVLSPTRICLIYEQLAAARSQESFSFHIDSSACRAAVELKRRAVSSDARGTRRLFQPLHRYKIRAGAVTHPCDSILCQRSQGRRQVAYHDVERKRRRFYQARDQNDIR
jgi:hypothetical protein